MKDPAIFVLIDEYRFINNINYNYIRGWEKKFNSRKINNNENKILVNVSLGTRSK